VKLNFYRTVFIIVVVVGTGVLVWEAQWRSHLNSLNALSASVHQPVASNGPDVGYGFTQTPNLTLKQIICKIDSLACKKKLQYEVAQQYHEGRYIWVFFMWPNDRSWERASGYAEEGGVPVYISDADYASKIECAQGLLEILENDTGPNFNLHPDHEITDKNGYKPPQERGFSGPLNCDPHRQCQ